MTLRFDSSGFGVSCKSPHTISVSLLALKRYAGAGYAMLIWDMPKLSGFFKKLHQRPMDFILNPSHS